MKQEPMKPAAAVYVALFAGLTAVSAFMRFPLAGVPVTLQTAAVLLGGMVLGAKYGALSQGIYIVMGLLGLPVFASGGGLAYIQQPSFGYLAGFLPAAAVCGLITRDWRNASRLRLFLAGLSGLAVIYVCGVSYLYFFLLPVVQQKSVSLMGVLSFGLFPYIPFDLVKILGLLPIIAILRRREHLFPGPGEVR